MTVNGRPPIVSVPERPAPVFGATLNATLPGPAPLDPPVIVIQSALLDADHEHAGPAVMSTDPAPPAADMV